MQVEAEPNENRIEDAQTPRIREEAALIRRVRQGDRDAFRGLVERYQGRVYGLAQRIVGDRHEAEDLCQEVFLRAYRALDRFDTRYPFVNWLLRIASNTSRSALKRRRRPQSLTEGVMATLGTPAEPTPQEAAENVRAVGGALVVALGRLSETKRTALLLFHQSQRSYADIAEIMELPIGTVKTAIHRARTEIRQVLSDRGLLDRR
jgi:RNA polymerase sigma-70 factor (ECF subfamily)